MFCQSLLEKILSMYNYLKDQWDSMEYNIMEKVSLGQKIVKYKEESKEQLE